MTNTLLQFGLEVPTDSDFGRAWHQLLKHVCDLSATALKALAAEDVRKQYSRTMIELLVHAAPHNYSEALERGANQAIPWYVRRAREYMHDRESPSREAAREMTPALIDLATAAAADYFGTL